MRGFALGRANPYAAGVEEESFWKANQSTKIMAQNEAVLAKGNLTWEMRVLSQREIQ